jgi:hypothetical protein
MGRAQAGRAARLRGGCLGVGSADAAPATGVEGDHGDGCSDGDIAEVALPRACVAPRAHAELARLPITNRWA